MNTGNSDKNRLEQALGRVHKAIERLEKTVGAYSVEHDRSQRTEHHLKLVVDENASLKQEQEQLSEAINMLQGQYDDLQKVATNIYGKLDDSVRRISKIIGD
ncbi:MAG: hypothetical protein AB7F82_08055 [Alphaproteobacteria bacterium]